MGMMLILLLTIPAAASALIGFSRKRETIEWIHAIASVLSFIAAAVIAVTIWMGQEVIQWQLLRADALSVFFAAIITFVGAVTGVYAVGYMRLDESDPARIRIFFALFQLFVFTMLLAVTTDNLGLMWVAIEGTTLATVFLVTFHDSETALQAAYKYLMISSVGIAMAFMGTVLMYYAAAARVGEIGLSWTSLIGVAAQLDPSVVKLAFVFILIGYGTKAGLAPMHTWLPDTYSEAPAPVSALMSGALSTVGMYALIRFKSVIDITLGTAYTSTWLMRFGLLSLGIAAAFLVSQRNYKRMLAYSSVEHTGIVALGLGFGGYWGTVGALLHILNHSLSKSMLFILSGSIRLKYRTTEIRGVRGLLGTSPWTGAAFLCGVVALLGLPPFGLFISEFMVFRAGFEAGAPGYAVAGIAFLALAFAGMLAGINAMLYGKPAGDLDRSDPLMWHIAPVALNVVLLAGLGLTFPNGVRAFFDQVLLIVGVSH